MEKKYDSLTLRETEHFIRNLPSSDEASIRADIRVMETGDFDAVRLKTLRGKIKELIVGDYRLIFFISEHILYFVRAFRKKTKKTPFQEIEYAKRIYKTIIQKKK